VTHIWTIWITWSIFAKFHVNIMPLKDAAASYCSCLRLIVIIKTPHKTGNLRINVTMRRVRATIVVVEKLNKCYISWVCVCSLSYPTCNALAPYCHVACPAVQYLFTSSHKPHDFIKMKVIEHAMRALIFSTTFVWKISHSKKKWARCGRKCILVFM
jgi:hypothetical protein